MRLIVISRLLTRQLCRAGLHRWRRARNVSSLPLGGPSGISVGTYFTDVCARPWCRAERSA